MITSFMLVLHEECRFPLAEERMNGKRVLTHGWESGYECVRVSVCVLRGSAWHGSQLCVRRNFFEFKSLLCA